ncbi:platelet-activating factor acetylhydrolase IB subunit beta-like [Sipha flava]|uniref:Platelet-activating factor acetylhydrolase IB subunit beta-like n=1 Tax=Sipha flava TaxID=143950 RepID=A0A8B8GAV1_9HEMI|nr:platelet-activating factor acetylhydrolase IB subunit beta-like [Sipha flava]XP_025419746.1 platelet-activating factor acetylhydrolase IB subunit beta-like [Sipha flava]
MNICAIPKIPYDGQEQDEWIAQHNRHVTEARKRDPDVILIGASIIQYIESCPIWNDKFKPLNSLNFGIAGDRTENVLWRVKNGILDNIKPKICILNVGTNNFDNNPCDVSEGILAIVNEIRSKIPNCYIIIIGLLPYGPYPNPIRDLGNQVNIMVGQKVGSLTKVELSNPELLNPDGSLSQLDSPDYLHPSEMGYRKIFNPVFDRIATILSDSNID